MEEGGQIFFAAARDLAEARRIAGLFRSELGRSAKAWDLDRLEFAWITGFPAFELVEDRLEPMHHPFTDFDLPVEAEPERAAWLALRSRAYDLALNGEELGSGSIRIHDVGKQLRALELLGYGEARARASFPHLLAGLEYGAPPHGGIALGFDRLISRLLDVESIRQVIAFPKDGKGHCLMTGSPSPLQAEELRLLGLAQAVEEPETVGA
jgi:aspartyl-tRNA synthetase